MKGHWIYLDGIIVRTDFEKKKLNEHKWKGYWKSEINNCLIETNTYDPVRNSPSHCSVVIKTILGKLHMTKYIGSSLKRTQLYFNVNSK